MAEYQIFNEETGFYERITDEDRKEIECLYRKTSNVLLATILTMSPGLGKSRAMAYETNNSPAITRVYKTQTQTVVLDKKDEPIVLKKVNKVKKVNKASKRNVEKKKLKQLNFEKPFFNNEKFLETTIENIKGGYGEEFMYNFPNMKANALKMNQSFVAGVIIGILATFLQNFIRWLRNFLKKQGVIEKLRGGKTPKKRNKIEKFLFGASDNPQKVETWQLIALGLLSPLLILYSATMTKFFRKKVEMAIDKTKETIGMKPKEKRTWMTYFTENAFQMLLMACIFLVINKEMIKGNMPEKIKANMGEFIINITKIFQPALGNVTKSPVMMASGFGFDSIPPTQMKKKYTVKTPNIAKNIKKETPKIVMKDLNGTENKKPDINLTDIDANYY